jgi:transcriptional regulator with XRE-family HTH domain
MLTAMNLIGKNIDRLLKAKGWNQAKLAEKVDKPSSRVSELKEQQ